MTKKRRLTIIIAFVTAVALVGTALGVVHETSGSPRPSITIRPTASVVPSGQLVRITHMTADGGLISRYLVDPSDRRCVQEIAPDACPPFSALVVFDDSGKSSLNGLTLEVRETSNLDTSAVGGYEEVVEGLDTLAGQTFEREAVEEVGGKSVWVVSGHDDLQGEEGSGSVHVTGYVDPSSGLVVREEVSDGSRTSVVVRELGTAAMWQYSDTERSDLADLAKNIRRERIQMLETLSWDTYALPEGEEGLHLMWLAPSVKLDYCRLEYENVKVPGESAVSVVLRDLTQHPDYPSELMGPFEEAVVDDQGEFQRVSFRLGDTAVQVLVVKQYTTRSAKEWAAELIPSSEAGLR